MNIYNQLNHTIYEIIMNNTVVTNSNKSIPSSSSLDDFLVIRIFQMIQAKTTQRSKINDQGYDTIKKILVAKYEKIKEFLELAFSKRGCVQSVISETIGTSNNFFNSNNQESSSVPYLFDYNAKMILEKITIKKGYQIFIDKFINSSINDTACINSIKSILKDAKCRDSKDVIRQVRQIHEKNELFSNILDQISRYEEYDNTQSKIHQIYQQKHNQYSYLKTNIDKISNLMNIITQVEARIKQFRPQIQHYLGNRHKYTLKQRLIQPIDNIFKWIEKLQINQQQNNKLKFQNEQLTKILKNLSEFKIQRLSLNFIGLQQDTKKHIASIADAFTGFIKQLKQFSFIMKQTQNLNQSTSLKSQLSKYVNLIKKELKQTQTPEMKALKSNLVQLCKAILPLNTNLIYNSYGLQSDYEKYTQKKEEILKQIKLLKDKTGYSEKKIANNMKMHQNISMQEKNKESHITTLKEKIYIQTDQIEQLKKLNSQLTDQCINMKKQIQNQQSYQCQTIQIERVPSQTETRINQMQQLTKRIKQLQNDNQQLKTLKDTLVQEKERLTNSLQQNKKQFQSYIYQNQQQKKRHYQLLRQLIQNNQFLNIQINYSQSLNKGDKSQQKQLNSLLVAYIKIIFQNCKNEKTNLSLEKAALQNQQGNLEKQINKLQKELSIRSEQLRQVNQMINQNYKEKDDYLNTISSLTQNNSSLTSKIKKYSQIIERKTQEITQLSQQKELQNLQIQSLQNKFIQMRKTELERERQYKISSLFDGRSCMDNSKESFPIKQSLISQIEKTNGKTVKQTCLLYKYSPQVKLQWAHFINKPHFVMLIRTEKGKIIAVYSQSPIVKPPLNQDKKEDIAFIFESNIKGEDTDFYPLLSGKYINGSFGNSVAFGKSDLRFALSDTVIEGNFGYAGTSFEAKGKKITDLLGSSKVRMTAYEIYSVELSEQVEVKAQGNREQGIVNLQQMDRKVEMKLNNDNHEEKQLKTLQMDYQRQKAELNKTISELQQTIGTQRDQIAIKSQECEQLKEDIRNSLSKSSEVQQRLHQSQKIFAEIELNLKQGNERYADLQKEKTHLAEMHDAAVSQIERLKAVEGELNSRIVDLLERQSKGEESAASHKSHEQQSSRLKTLISRLQKELSQTRRQKEQLQAQYNETSKARTLLQTQICDLELKISELSMKIQQYEYDLQGDHTKEVPFVREENEPQKELFKLQQEVEEHKQSHHTGQREITVLTQEVNQLKTVNEEINNKYKEWVVKTESLEREKTEFSSKLLQLQSDNQLLITKITVQSLQTERLHSENNELQKTNKQLHQKLTEAEAASLKESINRQMKVSPTTAKLPPSAAAQLQHYNKLAETYHLDPFLIAQYDKFFEAQVMCNQLQHKITLIRHLQLRMNRSFSSARLVYRYDPFNATIFHKYVDGLDNLLCLVKTAHGVYLAGYYSGAYIQNQILNKPGCLISITNNESYDLHNQKTHPSQRAFRGMIFNEFFIIFGNAEIRIRANEKTVFSNFGIAASFFNPRNRKVHDLLGEGESRQVEFESYELYQVTFEQQQRKME